MGKALKSRLSIFLAGAVIIAVSLLVVIISDQVIDENKNIISWIQGFSFTLASATFVVIIIDAFLLNQSIAYLKDSIGDVIENKLSASGIAYHGVTSIHNGLPIMLVCQSMTSARELYILHTFIANIRHLEQPLIEFFEKGGIANILLLDPKSKLVEIRAAELEDVSPADFRRNIANNISVLKRIGGDRARIRLWDGSPTISLYGDDDRLFVGHFFRGMHSFQGPILEVRSSDYRIKVLDYFNLLWNIKIDLNKKEIEEIEEIYR